MTLKEALFELIEENVLIDFDEKNDQNETIEIIETNHQDNDYKTQKSKKQKLHSVKIVGIEKIIIAFKPDDKNYHFLGGLIKDKVKHIKKACDGIIFCKIKGQNYVLLVELKSDYKDGLQDKYKAGRLFITFLNEILKSYYNIKENFMVINILFDTNPQKGKPMFLPVPNQRNEEVEIYVQQGFQKSEGNESRIRDILNAINKEQSENNDITYIN